MEVRHSRRSLAVSRPTTGHLKCMVPDHEGVSAMISDQGATRGVWIAFGLLKLPEIRTRYCIEP